MKMRIMLTICLIVFFLMGLAMVAYVVMAKAPGTGPLMGLGLISMAFSTWCGCMLHLVSGLK